MLDDPTRSAYHPKSGYTGSDGFDLEAFGNDLAGSAVTEAPPCRGFGEKASLTPGFCHG